MWPELSFLRTTILCLIHPDCGTPHCACPDPTVYTFDISLAIQALLQDRDNCVKALLKAQEKATGKGIPFPTCDRLSKLHTVCSICDIFEA